MSSYPAHALQDVDIFSRDYIVLPISDADGISTAGTHWSVVIICHLPVLHAALATLAALQGSRTDLPDGLPQQTIEAVQRATAASAAAAVNPLNQGLGEGLAPTPVIIHLDSLPGGHGLLRRAAWSWGGRGCM